MRPIREWTMTTWLILIGLLVIFILMGVILFVVLTPTVFTPPTEVEQPIPGIELPPELTGPPTFPQSPIEQIPLDQIQGLDTLDIIDQRALGGLTQVTPLTTIRSDFISLSPNGSSVNFYDPDQSRFFRVNQDGIIESINSPLFAEVEDVTYADDGSNTILEFPDGSNIVYNLDTQEQISLPDHWADFDFSPSSDQIAFKSLALDETQRWLAVSNLTGSSARQIEPLGNNADDLTVEWSPNNQVVGTYAEPTGLTTSNLFYVGFNGENFPLSRIEGINPESSWNPDGRNLLYSVAHDRDGFLPRLWIVDGGGDALGQNRRSTSLNTWTHKCAFSDATTAICGVPQSLPEGAGLIPAIADDIADNLVEVDLTTGQSRTIAIPSDRINVSDITVNDDGTTAMIQDSFSGTIVKIDL